MKAEYADIPVTDNTEKQRFEMLVDGRTSIIEYRLRGDDIALVHTEVPEALEGKGVAGALVEKVLLEIEKSGKSIIPLCAYVQSYLKRHPDWSRLVKNK
jgi:predicted GNAT family acetyltransferase